MRAVQGEAQARAAATYNAASDTYDSPANTFWAKFGQRTVERLALTPGARVLDVCCGSGASAIPAAQIVGPKGSVTGVDLSEKLLALARGKAKAQGLRNIEFRTADMLELPFPDRHFDAVVCVFGVFFVPDMPAAVRSLWRLVKSGGTLAITTWGPRFFEPGNTAFWDAVRAVRPELYKGFNPWDRIVEPAAVLALLREAGIEKADAVPEAGEHPISGPVAWWAAVLGSGYRGTLEQLSTEHRERVKSANLQYIRESGVRAVEANVVYAVARKS
jgi:ubiquinone/menaquinone biosynthesis C-methylase UbiE